MIHLRGAIVCEGKYDKIKLSSVVDCPIITTDGFGVFKDPGKRELIKRYAKNGGIVIITDSDSAGFKIRSYIKGFVKEGTIKNVYIPDILGKERRKAAPSCEGKLGVEGMSEDILVKAFKSAGIIGEESVAGKKIERADLYEDGLFGRPDSSERRSRLLSELNLPCRLSVGGLLDFLNSSVGYDGYKELVRRMKVR